MFIVNWLRCINKQVNNLMNNVNKFWIFIYHNLHDHLSIQFSRAGQTKILQCNIENIAYYVYTSLFYFSVHSCMVVLEYGWKYRWLVHLDKHKATQRLFSHHFSYVWYPMYELSDLLLKPQTCLPTIIQNVLLCWRHLKTPLPCSQSNVVCIIW